MISIGPLVFARRDRFRVDQLRAILQMQYCLQPGCSAQVARGYCRAHAVRDNYRVRRWYRIERWFRLRQQVLVEAAYTCAQCGTIQQQLEVDHITKHEGNAALFWNPQNLQALCPSCHMAKTKAGG